MKEIKIIGGGPGDEAYILPAARRSIEVCDKIAGDRRMLTSFGLDSCSEKVHVMDSMTETLEWMKAQGDESTVGLIVSGDPLIYSMYNLVGRTFPGIPIEVIPGIGSIQLFAARLGEGMEDSCILSGHGRQLTREKLLESVRKHTKVFVLCDKEHHPGWFAGQLMAEELPLLEMAAGSRLSYPDERILRGTPEMLMRESFPGLSLVMIKRLGEPGGTGFLLRDEAFQRNGTPMTREEIRWIILGKLNLKPDAVLWDIGAGTGSVSMEAARYLSAGKVIAIEKNPRALELLYKNRKGLRLTNVDIVEGRGAEKIHGLEPPTHIFIGGAGEELEELLSVISGFKPGIPVAIACVTLETLTSAYRLCGAMDGLKYPELVTIRIEHSRPVGSYHMMDGGRPVTLVLTETGEGHTVLNKENANDKKNM